LISNIVNKFKAIIKRQTKPDQENLNNMETLKKGSECELKVQSFFAEALKDTCPKVMISNFYRSNFCGLFKNFECHGQGRTQELDQVIILGEYRTVVILEAKAGGQYKNGLEKSLNRKAKFFKYFF